MMRKPPRELDHFLKINDLRLIFEKEVERCGGEMKFFFTDLELKKKGIRSPLIPDALMRFTLNGGDYRFAIEYDNGTETPRYFASTKVRKYIQIDTAHRPLFNLTDFRILIFTENSETAYKLMRGAIRENPPSGLFYFAAIREIAPEDILSDIYLDPAEIFSLKRSGNKWEVMTGQRSRIVWHCLAEVVSRGGASTHHEDRDKLLATREIPSPQEPNIPAPSRNLWPFPEGSSLRTDLLGVGDKGEERLGYPDEAISR